MASDIYISINELTPLTNPTAGDPLTLSIVLCLSYPLFGFDFACINLQQKKKWYIHIKIYRGNEKP